jgi:small subunit ribosomal protein S2
MVNLPTFDEMSQAGLHLGHWVSKTHPKMLPYIETIKNNIHLIDLEKTQKKLKEALDFVRQIAETGGLILFVGTKPPARKIIEKYAPEVNCPYVSERWLGGTLTNFEAIHQRIEKYKKMLNEKETGEWNKYTKKERLILERELARLEKLLKGIANLNNLPACLYVIDVLEEAIAVREAKRTKIPVVALVGTNNNPDLVSYPIPGNDDATKSIELVTKLVVKAIKEGQEKLKSKTKK